jgi:hypothetical protein
MFGQAEARFEVSTRSAGSATHQDAQIRTARSRDDLRVDPICRIMLSAGLYWVHRPTSRKTAVDERSHST